MSVKHMDMMVFRLEWWKCVINHFSHCHLFSGVLIDIGVSSSAQERWWTEKIIFDSIMRFLNKNKLLSDAQSGFRPSDSCEYQLLSIVYNIYKSFDCSPPLEVRGFFQTFLKPLTEFGMMVDIIMSFGISETPLKLIENFMSNRSQIVVLNDLHLGQRFQLGFLRDLFWGLCFSWCISWS